MPITNYIWDVVSDNVLMEKDDEGNTIASYEQEPGLYGEVISQRRSGQTSYYNFDGQGSTRELTDQYQNTTDTYTYDAFGVEVAKTGTTTNSFGYIGASGYYHSMDAPGFYVRLRYYDSTCARWTSVDRLGFIDGVNLYVYVSNSPLTRIDPTGAWLLDHQRDQSSKGTINPVDRDKLSGASWHFRWQFGDLRALVQQVTAKGSFWVVPFCGRLSAVTWEETYIEAWTFRAIGNVPHFARDSHVVRPKRPADYIETQAGRSFTRQGSSLYFGIERVDYWGFHLWATFSIINGNYANWNVNPGVFKLGPNNFQITSLTIDNTTVTPGRTGVFNRLLHGGGNDPVLSVFPPPVTQGRLVTSNDEWFAEYYDGDTTVTNTYKRSGYA